MTRILMILTSCDKMGQDGAPTGFYWEEMAIPYWTFRDAGYEVDLASPLGGQSPADPSSDDDPAARSDAVTRFVEDTHAMQALSDTAAVSKVDASRYDAVFLPGGHGTMWDLRQTPAVAKAVSTIYENGGVVGAVCHGPAGLIEATLSDGTPLIKGRRINGFTNSEERAAGLSDVVPYLLEDALRKQGAEFECGVEDFCGFALRDDRIVTGQNPDSSAGVAEYMLAALRDTDRAAA
ncbi:molecular chaperone Hsp31 and glyoxalase 3 [Roseovarius sp. A-2]|uniref:type 1 glutamine amidotransferase domain-containing protein n=1 Tax=Roseovarius sp. A-2 TaxID=1570360 RepID=UPI0009B54D97|nr:type 1 glutamine amidotransferase domain-containing protein [Roseovarius sp. A-2]GAW33706.1 molecular chaperone Hsp31 and glyoxalase 3 [Roseovarius sp. A-2]